MNKLMFWVKKLSDETPPPTEPRQEGDFRVFRDFAIIVMSLAMLGTCCHH